MTIYIINKNIFFDSERCQLRNQEKKTTIYMHATASGCFKYLLDRHGTIVLKEEIFEQVWYQYGLTITDNTYYQTVLHLRRQLIKVGFPEKSIQTIPRKGLLFPSTFEVKISKGEGETEDEQPDDKESEAHALEPPLTRLNELNESPQIDSHNQLVVVKKDKNLPEYAFWNKNKNVVLLLFTILITAFIFFGFLNNNIFGNDYTIEWDWDEYQYVNSQFQCNIYFKGDIPKEIFIKHLKQMLNKEICVKSPYIYATRFSAVKRESVIMCKKKIDFDANKCVSAYNILK